MADENQKPEPHPGVAPETVTETPNQSGASPTDGGQTPPNETPATAATEDLKGKTPADLMARLDKRVLAELATKLDEAPADPDAYREWLAEQQGGTQPPDTQPEAPEGGQPQKPPEEEEGSGGVKKIRTQALEAEESIALSKAVRIASKEKIPLADALARVGLAPAPAAQPAKTNGEPNGEPDANAEPATTPTQPQTVEAIDAKIEELKAERVRMRTEEFNFDRADEIGDEIAELKSQRQFAAREAQEAQNAARTFAQREEQAVRTALRMFPDLADETSETYQRYADARDLAEFRNDPILADPEWPVRIAERIAGKGAAPGTTVPPTKVPVPPSVPSRPAGTVAQAQGGRTQAVSAVEAMRIARQLGPEGVRAALAVAMPG